jgi:hypothetical protein
MTGGSQHYEFAIENLDIQDWQLRQPFVISRGAKNPRQGGSPPTHRKRQKLDMAKRFPTRGMTKRRLKPSTRFARPQPIRTDSL